MAKFWSRNTKLSIGDGSTNVVFHDHLYSTENENEIAMLRKKAKIIDLGIVEMVEEAQQNKIMPSALKKKTEASSSV